jgi:hypothetical protein
LLDIANFAPVPHWPGLFIYLGLIPKKEKLCRVYTVQLLPSIPSNSLDIGVEVVTAPVKHSVDILLITVPLFVMTYFLFDPAAFNAFTAWLVRVL